MTASGDAHMVAIEDGGQFATIEFTDDGTDITVDLTGLMRDGRELMVDAAHHPLELLDRHASYAGDSNGRFDAGLDAAMRLRQRVGIDR